MKYVLMAAMSLAVSTLSGQDAADDLKKMAGTWRTLLHEADGKPTPKDLVDKTAARLVVEGNKYKAYFGDKLADEGTIKLMAGKKHKELDVTSSKGIVLRGIYKIAGDEMTVCFGGPDGARPLEFKTKEGTGQLLLGYTRVKK